MIGRTILFIFLASLIPYQSKAEDWQWRSAEFTPTLGRGRLGSEFHLEMEQYRKPYSPDYTAKAILNVGILNHWQMSLELREDILFFENSLALLSQYEFLNDDNNPFGLRSAINIKYRWLADHSEISFKILLAKMLFEERLMLACNFFAEDMLVSDRPLIYGLSSGAIWRFNHIFSLGGEHQLRLETEDDRTEWLAGGLALVHFKTTEVPVYYMLQGKKILRSHKSIHGVALEFKSLYGLTDAAPQWIFSIGVALIL